MYGNNNDDYNYGSQRSRMGMSSGMYPGGGGGGYSMDPPQDPQTGSATRRLLKLMENPAAATLLERALAEDTMAMAPGPRAQKPSRLLANMGLSQRLDSGSYSSSPRDSPFSENSSRGRYKFDDEDDYLGGGKTHKVFCGYKFQEPNSFMTRSDIREVFADFGPVADIDVANNQKFAVISFKHATAASDAIKLMNNTSLTTDGPTIRVEQYSSTRGASRGRGSDRSRGRGGERRGRSDRDLDRSRDDDRRRDSSRGSRRGEDSGISRRLSGRGRDSSRNAERFTESSSQRVGGWESVKDTSSKSERERKKPKLPEIFMRFLDKAEENETRVPLTDEVIRAAIEQFGEISEIKVPKRGTFAFVSFESAKSAQKSIDALNNEALTPGGPLMKLEWVKDSPRTDAHLETRDHSSKRLNVKDRLQNLAKIFISQKEEDDAIALDVPIEALYCQICDSARFAHTKHYVNHLRGHHHYSAREIIYDKHKTMLVLLEQSARLADMQKDVRLSLGKRHAAKYVDGFDDPLKPTPERTTYNQQKGRQKCAICESNPFDRYVEFMDHLCSAGHLKRAYEVEQEKSGSGQDNEKAEQEDKSARVAAEIESAKEMAEMCPISLDEPPPYDPEESFGMENIEKLATFHCTHCDKYLPPGSVRAHCRSVPHYEKCMSGFKKRRAEQASKSSKRKRDEEKLDEEVDEGLTKYDHDSNADGDDFEVRSEASENGQRENLTKDDEDLAQEELDEEDAMTNGDHLNEEETEQMEVEESAEKRIKLDDDEDDDWEKELEQQDGEEAL